MARSRNNGAKQNQSNNNAGSTGSNSGKWEQGNKKNKRYGHQPNKSSGMRGKQGKKDSSNPRVNFDNAREDKIAARIIDDAKSGRFNDINDFLKNPTLLRSAANLPIYPILGSPVGHLNAVPGVMTIRWIPSVGQMQQAMSAEFQVDTRTIEYTLPPLAVNQAADSMYSYLVHANSRNYNYNSADLFMLIIAGAQVFAIIKAMERAYGLIKRYTETSRYMPDTILEMLGFDPYDMRKSFSHMWYDINNLIMQTRQIWIPNTLPITSRWMEMSDNIYKDSEGDYSQLYAFVQGMYLIYDETASPTGGMLRRVNVISTDASGDPAEVPFQPGFFTNNSVSAYKWDEWVSVAQSMIDALVNSEDRGIIYGDILNAYTASNILALPEIAADYLIDPVYTPEVLMQIENIRVFDKGESFLPHAIMQIENKIFPGYYTKGQMGRMATGQNWSLNFHTTADPTPEMIVLATRYMSLGLMAANVPYVTPATAGNQPVMDEYATWVPASVGTEIPLQILVAVGPKTSVLDAKYKLITQNLYQSGMTGDLMSFDWHPFYCVNLTPDPTVGSNEAPTEAQWRSGYVQNVWTDQTYGDHDKYTEVVWSELRRINDVAEFSLWGVPHI